MKITQLKRFLLLSAIVLFNCHVNAQLIGASAYLIGDNVEIGINDAGHEGAPRLLGSNNRSNLGAGSPVYFGFVANPQLDGWINYDGDFFTPGTPENGFGLEFGGSNYSNNASGVLEQIPGSITDYDQTGNCITVQWDGMVDGVDMKIVYRLVTTELYYTTEVTLTNNGDDDLTDVYYYRNVDPDNNITLGAGYSTTNTVVSQPEPGCETALVTATQTAPWDSYIGFGALGAEFRVSYGGFANRDASNIWNGVGGLIGTVGASLFADRAISLAYKIDDLLIGAEETFMFTVILDADQIDAALSSLYLFEYDGTVGEINACDPVVDTAYICPGETVELSISGPDVDAYNWVWGPATGLSVITGPITDANPVVTTEYTVVGTPDALCLSSPIEKTIIVEVTPVPEIAVEDVGLICDKFSLDDLDISNLEGSDDIKIQFYGVIPDSVDQVEGIWMEDSIGFDDDVYILMYDTITFCFDVEPIIIDFGGGANAGLDSALTLCNSLGSLCDVNTLIEGGVLGGVWTETSDVLSGALNPLTGIFNAEGVEPGIYDFKYLVEGAGECSNDSALMVITVNLEPIAGIDGAETLCNTAGSIIDLDDLLLGNNALGTWFETTASGQFDVVTGEFDASGLPTGVYTFEYTVVGLSPCLPDIATFLITVLDSPNAGDDNSVQLCNSPGTSVDLNDFVLAGDAGGVWINDMDMPEVDLLSGIATIEGWDAGTYTFTYQVGSLLFALCPPDEATITIEIRDIPIINAGDDLEVCTGETVSLEGDGAGAEGVYFWDRGVLDGVPFVVTETNIYTLTGRDEYGCENNDEVLVTALVLPIIDAGPDLPICTGDDVVLEGTGAGVGGFYEWDGGAIDGLPVSPITTTEFVVVGTDAAGCENTDVMSVVVNPLPIIFAGEDDIACVDGAATLAGSGAGVGGVYTWDRGVVDGIPFYPLITDTYTVRGTDVNGCSDVDDVVISMVDLPIVYAGEDGAICIGDELVLEGTGAGRGAEYIWDLGVVDSEPFAPTETAIYILTGTDMNGCKSTDEVEVVVNALPIVEAGPDREICVGDMVTLAGEGAGIGVVYDWDRGGVDGVPFAPVLTGMYHMVGTDANGCSSIDSVSVFVNYLPVISAGDDRAICYGDSTLLEASGAGVGGFYSWEGGLIDGEMHFPLETDVLTVIGTDINGCENSDEVLIYIYENPVVIAGEDTEICVGDEVTLVGAGAGAEGIYEWEDGFVDGETFVPAETAWYYLTGMDENECYASDSVYIVVNPLPIINAGEDTAICYADDIILSASGVGIGGSYEWDGGIADGIAFTPEYSNLYTVIGTDINGCVNSDNLEVMVRDLPMVVAGPDRTICRGELVTLSGYGAGIDGIYEWSGFVEDRVEFGPMVTANYVLSATDIFGCSNTDEVTVIVNPLPFVSAPSDKEICLGDALRLTGAGVGAGGRYDWTSGIVDGVSFNPAMTNTFIVTGTNAEGCSSTDSVTVTVLALPEIEIIADNPIGCAPLTVNFIALTDAASYEWHYGDGAAGSGSSGSHTFINSGLFDLNITVTSEDGCSNSETYDGFISVDATPVAGFYYTPDEVVSGDTKVQFINTSARATSYEWSFGDGTAMNSEAEPEHQYPEYGNSNFRIRLIAKSDNGCRDSSEQILNIKERILYFVPNAFTPDGSSYNEQFYPVFVSGLDVFDYSLFIYNRWGEVVFETHDSEFGWDGTYGNKGIVDDGVYIWKMEFGETMSDKKHYAEGHLTVLK